MSIRVDNVMSYIKRQNEIAVYIGNPELLSAEKAGTDIIRLTNLACPYPIGMDDRAEVCTMYELWLNEKIEDNRCPEFKSFKKIIESAKMGNIALLCWCHPLPCHADVLADKIRSILSMKEQTEEKEIQRTMEASQIFQDAELNAEYLKDIEDDKADDISQLIDDEAPLNDED